jgi:hypothetical protein
MSAHEGISRLLVVTQRAVRVELRGAKVGRMSIVATQANVFAKAKVLGT